MYREIINDSSFDVVVIGGGINGCGCALDSASRGFSTLLIDKSDFGSQTSSGCYKIVHGGLRYLQHFDIKRVLESLNEQKWLRVAAPHLVRPIPFLIPTYSELKRSKLYLGAGLTLYHLIDFNRNQELNGAEELPSFKIFNKEQTLKIAPYLDQNGLTGSVVYYDCQITHCERLTWIVAKTAMRYGANIANYTELTDFEIENGKIKSLFLKDKINNKEYKVRPKHVVFAAGPWNVKFLERFGIKQERVYSKGIQFAVPKLINEYALAVDSSYKDPEAIVSSGGRKIFIQPWKNYSLIGTSDSVSSENPDSFKIREQEVKELFEEIKKAYPDPRWDFAKVDFVFGGLRPVSDEASLDNASQDSKTSRRPMIEECGENFTVVTGIKYTTFRLLSEQVINIVAKKLGRVEKSKTKNLKLIGAELSKEEVYRQVLDEYPNFRELEEAYYTYGSELLNVLEYYKTDFKIAEASFAAKEESSVYFEDVLKRRTNISYVASDPEYLKNLNKHLSEITFEQFQGMNRQLIEK